MRHASLFSGIGGFDLAAEWMGWSNIFHCEIDPFCQRVLSYHFPSSHQYGDIRELDGTKYKGKIDILTGGFPCQPFSAAGRRRGTEDNRFLWHEMFRVIREIEPTWIIAENVRGIVSIEQGMVFERVCSDLEDNGYEVQPFCIPACSVGAPHRRERIWFVAHRKQPRLEGKEESIEGREEYQRHDWDYVRARLESSDRGNAPDELVANRKSEQCERDSSIGDRRGESEAKTGNRNWFDPWTKVATRLCRVDDGLPKELDGITVPKWRKESLKSYGNAIVPQIAFEIFKSIECAEFSNTIYA